MRWWPWWRPRWRVRTLAPFLLLAVALAAGGLLRHSGLYWNLTPSLPRGLYHRVPEELRPGVLVAACLPPAVAAEGRRRGILTPGRCPGGAVPVVKRVGAVAGQVVTVLDRGVFVDGSPLQPPAPTRDRLGRPLDPLPPGRYPLAPGELWLYTPVARSWDSRYYGPVPTAAVLATVEPLHTWPGESR